MNRSAHVVRNKTKKDDKDKEEENIAIDHKRAELRALDEKNKDLEANRELRWRYARWVFFYLVIYSTFVGFVIIISGFHVFGFTLSPSVLEFLVGSTAVSAIGLVAAVVAGLFTNKN